MSLLTVAGIVALTVAAGIGLLWAISAAFRHADEHALGDYPRCSGCGRWIRQSMTPRGVLCSRCTIRRAIGRG